MIKVNLKTHTILRLMILSKNRKFNFTFFLKQSLLIYWYISLLLNYIWSLQSQKFWSELEKGFKWSEQRGSIFCSESLTRKRKRKSLGLKQNNETQFWNETHFFPSKKKFEKGLFLFFIFFILFQILCSKGWKTKTKSSWRTSFR